ncbi:MAG: DUF4391 domain-containing protein [Marinospirillum sp.]|uniref:DUF4391 domain-containing protein n=1 Tax=Marinospirillum sp. TaxID=2183934 RepID=UPI0019EF6D05|nr:DUF4391 domain-containing protein [Marinospirillum sp.]MBE0508511.1 DUF4391 domain-containing protein [Marinospirillum sp.]
MTELHLGLPLFEAFLYRLGIPDSCLLNKPLHKKMFQQHADLNAADKKALKDGVEKIRWLYSLKPSTINIAPFSDDLHDYGELALLHVELRQSQGTARLGELINRAIPYPLVIFFTDSDQRLGLCLADKRINKADPDKWVLEDQQLSPWMDLTQMPQDEPSPEHAFLNSLALAGLPQGNFWQLYQALSHRLQALQAAAITGRFHLLSGAAAEQQRHSLHSYRQAEAALKKLRSQLKQAEFSQQVALNIQIKQQQQQLQQLAEQL